MDTCICVFVCYREGIRLIDAESNRIYNKGGEKSIITILLFASFMDILAVPVQ